MLLEDGTCYTPGTEITLYNYLAEKREGNAKALADKRIWKNIFKMDP
jgi:hypothetical protein